MEKIQNLEKAKNLLLAGGVVGMPTETVYGLAASIDQDAGIRKIFSIKRRPFFDPLIVHICDRSQLDGVIADWPPIADCLTRHFWPGPLTIVLKKSPKLNPLITAGLNSVGVRMPSHAMALALIKHVGTPLAAPSANLFGETSPTHPKHVQKSFPEVLVLDGSSTDLGIESTVVSILDNSKVEILRPGMIDASQIEDVLRQDSFNVPVTMALKSGTAPGQLEHHYAPKKPFAYFSATMKQSLEKGKAAATAHFKIECGDPIELKLDADPRIAARSLYEKLHALGESDASFIYFHYDSNRSETKYWDAIEDRLVKAASLRL